MQAEITLILILPVAADTILLKDWLNILMEIRGGSQRCHQTHCCDESVYLVERTNHCLLRCRSCSSRESGLLGLAAIDFLSSSLFGFSDFF